MSSYDFNKAALKERILALGLTVPKFCEKIGFKYESYLKLRNPRDATILRIEHALCELESIRGYVRGDNHVYHFKVMTIVDSNSGWQHVEQYAEDKEHYYNYIYCCKKANIEFLPYEQFQKKVRVYISGGVPDIHFSYAEACEWHRETIITMGKCTFFLTTLDIKNLSQYKIR
jgi:hypothetical protein